MARYCVHSNNSRKRAGVTRSRVNRFSLPSRPLHDGFTAPVRRPAIPSAHLRNRIRQDIGTHTTLSPLLRSAVQSQYNDDSSWSVQLHYDNLEKLVLYEPVLGRTPSPQPAHLPSRP